MENIAVVIEKASGRIVYVTSNSIILPKTDDLDRYLRDSRYQVLVDVETAVRGRVKMADARGEIVAVPLNQLDARVYHANLGWHADSFTPGREPTRQLEALTRLRIKPRADEAPLLELTTDAPDVSPLNGIPEIPADGKSAATIFVRLVSRAGQYLADETHDQEIFLRTTRGRLSHRQVRLERGAAQVKLKSTMETTIADVTAFGANLKPYTLHIEFAPVPEP